MHNPNHPYLIEKDFYASIDYSIVDLHSSFDDDNEIKFIQAFWVNPDGKTIQYYSHLIYDLLAYPFYKEKHRFCPSVDCFTVEGITKRDLKCKKIQ
ncbi:MAG: hypothetical protein LUQ42_05545 [Methanomicrobiales archaeon]|jgi:hypothetical protein|nr:hypothetical protein [Methanomicrobiales archaeon]